MTETTPSLAQREDQCLQAATEFRYVAEQLERSARFLRSRQFAQAEKAYRSAIEGHERAAKAWMAE